MRQAPLGTGLSQHSEHVFEEKTNSREIFSIKEKLNDYVKRSGQPTPAAAGAQKSAPRPPPTPTTITAILLPRNEHSETKTHRARRTF